jgi:hypothetical protein
MDDSGAEYEEAKRLIRAFHALSPEDRQRFLALLEAWARLPPKQSVGGQR